MRLINNLSQKKLHSLKLLLFDFDGVFTDNAVYVSEAGTELVKCSRLDGIGLNKIKILNLIPLIISSETNSVVSARAKKLDVACYQSVSDKASKIREICEKYEVNPENQLFLGNDINDIPAFDLVGISVAVADYYPTIKPYVKYVTNRPGGHGAVREVCDLVYDRLAGHFG